MDSRLIRTLPWPIVCAARFAPPAAEGTDPEKTYTVVPGKPQDILHVRGIGWDGIRGYSVITMARQSIGTALATDRNVARFYANGGRVPYVLEMAQRFRNDQDLRESLLCVAKHPDSRRCLRLLQLILENHGLADRLFCDTDCAEDWEYEDSLRRRLGLPQTPTYAQASVSH